MDKKQKEAVGVAAGLAALAATAAGIYFFSGKKGAKNRKKVAAWADDAKKEVMKQLKASEKLTKANYNKVIDSVAKQYKELKKVDQSEILALSKELKGHWDSIYKEITAATSQVKRTAKKAAPKTKPASKAPSKPNTTSKKKTK